jgi:hypothetical protein
MKYIVVSYLFVFILNLVCCTNNKKEVFSNLQGCWQVAYSDSIYSEGDRDWLFNVTTGKFNYYNEGIFMIHKAHLELPKGITMRWGIYRDAYYIFPYYTHSNSSIYFYDMIKNDWRSYKFSINGKQLSFYASDSKTVLLKANKVERLDDIKEMEIDSIGVEIEHDTYEGIVNTTIGINNTVMSVCTTNDMVTGHQRYNKILNYPQLAYLNRLASMALTETKDTIYPARASDMPDYKIHILTQDQAKSYVVDGGYYSAPFYLGALILYIDNLVGKITVIDDSTCN